MELATMKIIGLNATTMAEIAAETVALKIVVIKHCITKPVHLNVAVSEDTTVYSQIKAVSTVTRPEVSVVVKINVY
jgi:hypothetical protein